MNSKVKRKIENMCKLCKWSKISHYAYCDFHKEYISKLPIPCKEFKPTKQRKIEHFTEKK